MPPIALAVLFLFFTVGLTAQTHSQIEARLTATSHRADSIWFYGIDAEPIIDEMEAAQEAACLAGYDDLYVLSFVELSYVYKTQDETDRYASTVLQGWAEAQIRLPEDDVVHAVALGCYSHYCYEEVPEKKDSSVVWMKGILPELERSRFQKTLFWCQVQLAKYELYINDHPQASQPFLEGFYPHPSRTGIRGKDRKPTRM